MIVLNISVTNDDIDHGETKSCRHCPLARAIDRAAKEAGIRFGEVSVTFCVARIMAENFSRESAPMLLADVGDYVTQWIKEFDEGHAVNPFNTQLTFRNREEVASDTE